MMELQPIEQKPAAVSTSDFEAWVNNPHMIVKCTDPGCAGEYDHPWTRGAWEAWKECCKRFNSITK